ncbi:maleylacetoacetate isomerase-like [Watersipora subatra]|uniref:maleylacetoacetate isomerase-like n=1 Tax=Watersipora subatra TaxID=2589382 RepID=UPI00355B462E
MPKPVLYSYFRSSASWRVRIALALKGIDYDYSAVHLVKDGGEQHKDEYRAMNPMGHVPTLIIDGHTLTDSMAIMEYLEETREEGPKLLPADPVTRAKVRALSHVIVSSTQPLQNLGVIQYAASLNLDKVAWALHWITKGLTGFEKMVAPTAGKYCFGDELTLADLCLIPQLYNARRFGLDMSEFPHIARIVENCRQLEAFKKADAYAQPDTLEDLRATDWM